MRCRDASCERPALEARPDLDHRKMRPLSLPEAGASPIKAGAQTRLDLSRLREGESVLYVDTQISHGALYFRTTLAGLGLPVCRR